MQHHSAQTNNIVRVNDGGGVIDSEYPNGAMPGTLIEFSQRLHYRGTDFHVYANVGYQPNFRDTVLLSVAMNALLAHDVPVLRIKVKAFALHVEHNNTITKEEIIFHVIDAIHRAGGTTEPSSR